MLQGVFAGAEIAILALRKTRLQELVDSEANGSDALDWLRKHPEKFLATAQIGISLAAAGAAAFGGAEIGDRIEPYLTHFPWMAGWAKQIALFIIIASVAGLQLVLGELVPKSLALRAGEKYGLLAAPMLRALAVALTPAVWSLTALSNVVLRLFGDRTTFSEVRLSKDELLQLLDEAATAGSLDTHASEIATRALQFDTLFASDVMVRASEIRSLQADTPVERVAEMARDWGHARVVIIDGPPDNVLGFVNLREVLANAVSQPQARLRDQLHPIPYVAENMGAPSVLKELQAKRSHLAIVVDESGGIRGLVTIEDLLEELVGEIFSENDAPRQTLRKNADGSVLVPGTQAVHEVNRELGIELPEADTFSTMAGLAIEVAGRIPAQGDAFDLENGVRLEVVEASPRRVRLLRIVRPVEAATA